MVVETATIYSLFALFLVMLSVTTYFLIFFFIFAIICWGFSIFGHAVYKFLNVSIWK
jgi:hypothetical protein